MTEIAQEVREKRIALRMGIRLRTPWIEQHRDREQQVKEETNYHDNAKNTHFPEGIVREAPVQNPGPMLGGRNLVHALIRRSGDELVVFLFHDSFLSIKLCYRRECVSFFALFARQSMRGVKVCLAHRN